MLQNSESTYYAVLGLHPSASPIEIRRAYRELSKRYHPDTTDLPNAIATVKFQEINEAYAILSSPERRFNYDIQIGYSRWSVIQPPTDLNYPLPPRYDWTKSAYLDATERPLSSGEIFALFMLGLTLVGCLFLAIAIAAIRGDNHLHPQLSLIDLSSTLRQFWILDF
ncbi:J domain-containing protein [Calothrix sp. NIES-3974]|uniref:J domain-containing protein n=1 Tax=Calothrix sp. NIES-3974 TaxID=2005462 RepID=UPI000B60319F|nr:J domain-containing protein [Calothrix sp. NIES-3974]BAZ05392.1 heat shock protein DnaJ domain-containing protein [Calothrix sp. NIES-3974]